MIKKLLLVASAFCLIMTNTSAQTNTLNYFTESKTIREVKMTQKRDISIQQKVEVAGDWSYYYDSNNAIITFELNTHLGTTSPSTGGNGFDTTGLYVYTVKEKQQLKLIGKDVFKHFLTQML